MREMCTGCSTAQGARARRSRSGAGRRMRSLRGRQWPTVLPRAGRGNPRLRCPHIAPPDWMTLLRIGLAVGMLPAGAAPSFIDEMGLHT